VTGVQTCALPICEARARAGVSEVVDRRHVEMEAGRGDHFSAIDFIGFFVGYLSQIWGVRCLVGCGD